MTTGSKHRYVYPRGYGCAGKSTVTITDERGKKRRLVRDLLERLELPRAAVVLLDPCREIAYA